MLKVAVISPFSPGATSFFASAAVVQPQEGRTALMWTGVSPLFSYLKTATACAAPRSGLRSTSVFSKTNEACTEAAMEKQRLENKRRLPFMREAKRRTLAVSIKLIYFDDGHAGGAVRATNDRRVGPGQERCDNGRFRVARRRHASVEDCGLLRRSPVVIRSEERSAGVTHFQSWIRHRALDGQRRSDRTNNHVRPRLPDHNNSADQDVI